MAGYIGSKTSVTQVDGYNRTEADDEFVNDPNSVISVSGSNVGIGTTSPNARLEVEDGGSGKSVVLKVSADDSNPYAFVVGNDTFSTTDTNGLAMWMGNDGQAIIDARGTGAYHTFRVQGGERMRIDTSGRVTMPYQPAFAYTGTNYNQGAGASIIIPASTKLNTGGHYNGSTGVFTAPVSGFYIFGFFGLSYPHNSEVNQIGYFKNGVLSSGYMQFAGNASIHQIASGGYGVYLNANDTLDLRYYRSSGSAYAYASQWTMWGYLIG